VHLRLAILCSSLSLVSCSRPGASIHVVFTPPQGRGVASLSVLVAVVGSDAGVAREQHAADADAGLSSAPDLTITIPSADAGRCVDHDPTADDPPVIALTYTYSLVGESQSRSGTANLACRRAATADAQLELMGPPAWRLTDSGTTQTLTGVWADASSGEVFAVGAGATVLHSRGSRCAPQPECARFEIQPAPVQQSLQAVWGLAHDEVYAVGLAGTVPRYDGVAWAAHPQAAQLPADADLLGVWASTSNDLYVVGQRTAGPALFHFDGTAFAELPVSGTTVPKSLVSVWGNGPAEVYAAGATPFVVLIRAGAGPSFSLCQTVGYAPSAIGGSPRGPVVVEKAGRTTDLNPGCAPMANARTIPGNADLRAIWIGAAAGVVYPVGVAGGIWLGEGAMAVAQGSSALTTQDLLGVFGAADDDVYAVGTAGTIVHLH
jgi:hypothetical protein